MLENPRLFIANAELFERRPLEHSEYAELQRSAQWGRQVLGRAILGIIGACSMCCVGVTYSESPDDAGFYVMLLSMLGLAWVVLYARDGIATYRHYRSIRPDAEVMLFGDVADDAPEYTVLADSQLLIREGADWLKTPVAVEITEVAAASSRTEEVADWLLDEEGETATRMLEPAERVELERHLNNPEHKVRWYEWLFMIWAIVALSSLISGHARERAFTFVQAILVVCLGLGAVYRRFTVHRDRREIREALSIGMVGITRWRMAPDDEPTVIEALLPQGIPWSADGHPAPWRSL